MNERENVLSLLRREGYSHVPCEFNLCDSLDKEYKKRTGSALHYSEYFNFPWRGVPGVYLHHDTSLYLP